jgi:hypothetical protein
LISDPLCLSSSSAVHCFPINFFLSTTLLAGNERHLLAHAMTSDFSGARQFSQLEQLFCFLLQIKLHINYQSIGLLWRDSISRPITPVSSVTGGDYIYHQTTPPYICTYLVVAHMCLFYNLAQFYNIGACTCTFESRKVTSSQEILSPEKMWKNLEMCLTWWWKQKLHKWRYFFGNEKKRRGPKNNVRNFARTWTKCETVRTVVTKSQNRKKTRSRNVSQPKIFILRKSCF